MSQISIRIAVNAGQFQAGIMKEIIVHLNKVFDVAPTVAHNRSKTLIAEALEQSPTWRAIASGTLGKELFIPNGLSSLQDIQKAIIDSMVINKSGLTASATEIRGSFEIKLLDDNYSNILSLPSASYMTNNAVFIPWLNWLLNFGTEPVLRKAKLVNSPRGTLAMPSPNDLSIPSAHAGIKDDNFLTRALKPIEVKIGQIIEQEVSRRT